MWAHRSVIAIFLGFGLACAGLEFPGAAPPPEPVPEPAPVDPMVESFLSAEDPDGALVGEARTERVANLTQFIASHADVATWAPRMVDCLGAGSCATTEAAYEQVVADYATKPAVDVAAPDPAWVALVFVQRAYTLPDDWAATREAVRAQWAGTGVRLVELAHGQASIAVTLPDATRTEIDLSGAWPTDDAVVGLAVVDSDTPPTWLGLLQPGELQARMTELTGKCPVDGCAEAAEAAAEPAGANGSAPRGGGGGGGGGAGGRRAPTPPLPVELVPELPIPVPLPPLPEVLPPRVDLDEPSLDDLKSLKGKLPKGKK